MEIARYPLTHDIQFWIDESLDSGAIDAATYYAIMLYGDRELVRKLYDAPRPRPIYASREALILHANEILAELPEERRSALVYHAAGRLIQNVRDLAVILADWAINDEVNGGDLLPFRRRCREDIHEQPWRRIARRLRSPAWIRRYVQHNDDALRLRRTSLKALRRYVSIPKREDYEDEWEKVNNDVWLQRERHRLAVTEALREEARLGDMAELKVKVRLKPGVRQKRRALLKRGATTAAAVLGAPAVSALARGERITVNGPTVALQLSRRSSLATLGHGALNVAVTDHSGHRLADLCVYVEETPAIDQATAFALHMQAGEEAEMLSVANVITITPLGLKHPLLASRRSAANGPTGRRLRNDQYWADTAEIWLRELTLFTFGSNRAGFAIAREITARDDR